MIELVNNGLRITFPEVHHEAEIEISFQRTLRLPVDGREYPLPAGLGRFPLVHVGELPDQSSIPSEWKRAGGVLLPMYPSEAMWVNFEVKPIPRRGRYPVALKLAAGKINVVTGEPLLQGQLQAHQDYVVLPKQPWVDGYAVTPGTVRQFVATELGSGLSVEEQAWGWAEHGGIQLLAYPLSRSAFDERFPLKPPLDDSGVRFAVPRRKDDASRQMGLSAGGAIRQRIYSDEYRHDEWMSAPAGKCFVRIIHCSDWARLTGFSPPHQPITAAKYEAAGIPWFAEYSQGALLPGSSWVGRLKSFLGSSPPPFPVPQSGLRRRVIDVATGQQVIEGEF